jgi:UDP-N-acetyl-D-mannosaminuronic acid dehydrogenase
MQNYNKTVCVIGLGYIGLPTAALLACKGYSVNGVDINSNTVDTINGGGIHIVEPDLDRYVKKAVGSGALKAFLYYLCSHPFLYSERITDTKFGLCR